MNFVQNLLIPRCIYAAQLMTRDLQDVTQLSVICDLTYLQLYELFRRLTFNDQMQSYLLLVHFGLFCTKLYVSR